MKSSLKLKFNQATGETKLVTADGFDIIEHIETITDIQIHVSSTGLPKVVITCLLLDEDALEVEFDKAAIEVKKTYIKRFGSDD